MIKFPLCFGAVRHMKLIGEDFDHKRLRARNEARLAALKAANRLYEEKREPTPSGYQSTGSYNQAQYTNAAGLINAGWSAYEPGSALGQFLGLASDERRSGIFDDR